jgi:hypothetical protein
VDTNTSADADGGGAAPRYRRFFRDLLAGTFLPLLALAAVNAVVDPYRANRWFDLDLDREAVATVSNERLWKLFAYDRAPEARIVLGDSRCDHLRAEYFARAGVPDVYNLSFGGGTLPEIVDAYAFARARTRLDSVVICISFDVFNEGAAFSVNRLAEVRDLVERPVRYYLSPFVFRSSVAVLRQRLTGTTPSERPPMGRDAFWQYQLGPRGAGSFYQGWKRPDRLWQRLVEIAATCRRDGTKLVFLLPPNHVDLQAVVDEYALRSEYEAYKNRLATLAPVVDFDFPTDLTRDADAYGDPFHTGPEASERVVRELVSGSHRFSREIFAAPAVSAAPDSWPARSEADPGR